MHWLILSQNRTWCRICLAPDTRSPRTRSRTRCPITTGPSCSGPMRLTASARYCIVSPTFRSKRFAECELPTCRRAATRNSKCYGKRVKIAEMRNKLGLVRFFQRGIGKQSFYTTAPCRSPRISRQYGLIRSTTPFLITVGFRRK